MDRIAEGVERAQRESSAALRFDSLESKPHVAHLLPPTVAQLSRCVGTWLKSSWEAFVLEHGPHGEGRIDFAHRRSVYKIGSEWRLMVEDRFFVGRPGTWTELALGHVDYGPEWALATLARTAGSEVVGTRRIADEQYVELTGVATVDPSLWIDNGGRYMRLEWLESPVTIRAWIDPRGRLRLARLQWGADATPHLPTRRDVPVHEEMAIALGDFGAAWTLEAFDPDDARWAREPVG